MKTVLGLSVTSNSVGWVLLDGPGIDAATLDQGIVDVSPGSVDDGATSKCITVIQRVQAIAATSDHELKSIGLTWTADAAVTANTLLTSLPDLGFEEVVSVPLSEAAATWVQVYSGRLEFKRAAVCVVEPLTVTLLSFGYGGAHTSATHTRESDDGLSWWLKYAFVTNHVDPQHLFVIGSREDIGRISGRLGEALDMSVVTSKEAQLILARGAALMVRSNAEAVAVPVPSEKRATLKQNAAALAACAGVFVLLTVSPSFNSRSESPSTRDQPVSNSSQTSVGSQAVPPSPVAPPSNEVATPMVQPVPAPLPSSATSPPVAEVTAPEAPFEPLAEPEQASEAVPPEVPAMDVPQGTAPEAPAEGANLPAPAELPPLPAQNVDVPTEIPHLPPEGPPRLPGAGPLLAAEAPGAEATPTQTSSSPVLGVLP
jgi:hypothetical protein